MRNAITLGLGLATSLALAPAAPAQDREEALTAKQVDDPGLPDTYVGFYKIVSGEDDGEPLPADRIGTHLVRITESLITVLDADENTLYACEYALKPAEGEKPDRLDMENTGGPPGTIGDTARGIIRKGTNDEGRPFVMLCYRTIGDDYPDDFTTRADSETNLFVLEPIPDPAKGGAEPKN
ncbi:hypothetical protein [Tautonia plasticadhaerens]|uniref:Uncharacterized protein n=1 Tax=Tautonia plasticadhaerens TaxID=2527974 RepID=A0A518HAP9_9BACT|nr:hypothetical protein [Tautonia plasticadhaerens]QDV37887.1 hypothetical protein ElP_58340 [Tautonia plasticadhaerens]